jgi:hypothetical protein
MGTIRIRIVRLISEYWVYGILAIFLSGCQPIKYLCGDALYECRGITGTFPYQNPVKYDDYADVTLFADGNLVRKKWNQEPQVFDLRQTCASDTVCDILFYDRRYAYGDIDPPYDEFIIVITPDKLCKLDWFDNVTMVFGNSGPDSTRLISALAADLDFRRRIYVVDGGDNSIKVYDSFGNFISRWTDIGQPYKVQASDDKVWVLDRADDFIKIYNIDGEFIRNAIERGYFNNITTFFAANENEYWIADLGGERLTLYRDGQSLFKIHSDYCYMDAAFYIRKIVDLDWNYGINAVDIEDNLMIEFILSGSNDY